MFFGEGLATVMADAGTQALGETGPASILSATEAVGADGQGTVLVPTGSSPPSRLAAALRSGRALPGPLAGRLTWALGLALAIVLTLARWARWGSRVRCGRRGR